MEQGHGKTEREAGPDFRRGIDMLDNQAVLGRLDHLEEMLQRLLDRQRVQDWYTTEELAKLLGKAEFTVREWCRLGRIRAQKRNSGRGKFMAWVVSNEELQRFQREGLLPLGHN